MLGVDVGGTKIHCALFKLGKIVKQKTVSTPKKNVKKLVEKIVSVLKGVSPNPKAIGIGVPGFVSHGTVTGLPNIGIMGRFNLKRMVEKETKGNVKVSIDNDAKCFALAESRHGVLTGTNTFVAVTVGTGIGGAIVIGGKLHRGRDNLAGEFGHMKFIKNGKQGKKCGCGEKGCWETYCAGRWIKKVDVDACKMFGLGLANIANAFNPDMIVLGGSMALAYLGQPKNRRLVMKSFEGNALVMVKNTPIRLSRLNHPCTLGAALLTGN
ncbi:hypothetical protein COT30_00445 [Candidatus Micrarchaeota archaeon CG08_land_8_20_14_0_20_49_17]|nr:MAG: hypothetical protein COT30_00445 [Candidatus Micrarchaeota archaeon CG08_land_8_20_14_0_20_49_17]